MKNIGMFTENARKLIANYIKDNKLEAKYGDLDTLRFVFPEIAIGEVMWSFYYEKDLPNDLIDQLWALWSETELIFSNTKLGNR